MQRTLALSGTLNLAFGSLLAILDTCIHMASTVRIQDPAKDRLRRLQEAWHRARGERPSQQEILDKGLAYLERHRDAFLAESAWRPLTEAEIQQLEEQFQVRSGDTGHYDIDEVVYGEGA